MAKDDDGDRPVLVAVASLLFTLGTSTLVTVAFCAAYLLSIGQHNWTRVMIDERSNAMKFYRDAVLLDYSERTNSTPKAPTLEFYRKYDRGHEVIVKQLKKMRENIPVGHRTNIDRAILYCSSYYLDLSKLEKSQDKAFESAGALSNTKIPVVDIVVNSRDFPIRASMILGTLLTGIAVNAGRLRRALRLSSEDPMANNATELEKFLLGAGVHYSRSGDRFWIYGHGVALYSVIASCVFLVFLIGYLSSKQVVASPLEQFAIQNPQRLAYTIVALGFFVVSVLGALGSLMTPFRLVLGSYEKA